MKSTIASLLVLNLLNQPDAALSFTASRPLVARALSTAVIRPTTELNVKMPAFLSRNKEETVDGTDVPGGAEESISPEITEMALETSEAQSAAVEEAEEEELSETQKLLQKVKQAGTAGAISYALWELGFWGISIPVCSVGYYKVAGHWPDFSNSEDMSKLGAEAFAFVNFARLAVPLRIGLALSTTPWIDENVVQKFMKKDEGEGDN
jgi:hypothetical protein